MIWLLRLYPRPWRQRYGDEVAAMLAARPFSFAVAVDLVAGAIDVWLHPSATLAAATAASRQKERAMPEVTNADQWKAGGMMVGLTLALTLIWMYAHIRIGDNPYVDSLSIMPFMVAALFSMRYTYLKQRAASVQAVFIGGLSLAIAALMLAAGWISAQI